MESDKRALRSNARGNRRVGQLAGYEWDFRSQICTRPTLNLQEVYMDKCC